MESAAMQGNDEQTLASLFARTARLHAARPALTCDGVSLTYAALQQQASQVAAGLQQAGIAAGDLVAILLDRSPAMIAAMLGTVEAGAAYLPLDTQYPARRLADTVADTMPAAVILSRGSASSTIFPNTRMLYVEDLVEARGTAVVTAISAGDTAYVIYTSGSTGKPKGVEVSHHNVARLLSQTAPWFSFDHHDVWTMFHSFAFDFSVWETWGCLLSGGRLVIVPYMLSRSPLEFRTLLRDERVTVLNQTPSAFALLDAADAADAADARKLALRVIIFGGEALSGSMLHGWMARHGDAAPQLINMYGITETTVHVTFRRMLAADATQSASLIGEPIPDLRLYLLDEHLRPVDEGAEGELCIGGAGVAKGYLNRPNLTAERFVSDPFGPAGARMYRSGDIACRRADGELVFLGRRDSQVKLNGFRIELGEIESVITQHAGVTQACVVLRMLSGASQLIAFYTAPAELTLAPMLAALLPAHMRPSRYVRVPAFPLGPNGKIDRAALPEPVPEPGIDAPRFFGGTPMQQRVAGVWSAQLGHSNFGLDDNFFDVGGSSLQLIATRAQLERELARTIPVGTMFAFTSVRALAASLVDIAASPSGAAIQGNAEKQRQAFARARARSGGGR